MRNALAVMALTLSVLACNAPLTPAPTPTAPTRTPEPMPSPTARPSATPKPTLSPSPSPSGPQPPTPSPTPTYAVPSPTPTATPLSALDCRLNWQSPGNGIEFKANDDFTAGWKLTNTGTDTWAPGSVEFTYVGGAKLYRYPRVQLEARVAPGGSVILTVDMRAPRNSTKYTTYWSLRRGEAFFCRVSLSIYVK